MAPTSFEAQLQRSWTNGPVPVVRTRTIKTARSPRNVALPRTNSVPLPSLLNEGSRRGIAHRPRALQSDPPTTLRLSSPDCTSRNDELTAQLLATSTLDVILPKPQTAGQVRPRPEACSCVHAPSNRATPVLYRQRRSFSRLDTSAGRSSDCDVPKMSSAYGRDTLESRTLPPMSASMATTPVPKEESLPGSAASSPTMQDRDGDMSGDGMSVSGVKHQAAFVSKLYSMVEDSAIPTLQWSDSGTTFIVTSPIEFSKCLHNFFKHNNWQSFVRQLNMYQFHKVNDVFHSNSNSGPSENSAWEFRHACFRRGRMDLLTGIKRKASKPAHSSSHRDSFSTSGIKENSFFGHSVTHGTNGHSAPYGGGSTRTETMLELASQRITAGEETQRMLMDQNAAMFNVLRSYQNVLAGMANVLATISPTTSTQAIQNDLYTLDHHLRHLQFPNRHNAHAVAPTPYPSAPTPPPTWAHAAHSPSVPPLASPSSYFSPRIGASPEADYFRASQPHSRPAVANVTRAPSPVQGTPARAGQLSAAPALEAVGGLPFPVLGQNSTHALDASSAGAAEMPDGGPATKRARPVWPNAMPTPPLSDSSISIRSPSSNSMTSSIRDHPQVRSPQLGALAASRPQLGSRGGSLHSLLNDEDTMKTRALPDLKRRRSDEKSLA